MAYKPEEHHRRSIRLQGWDYRNPGAYFVTIVTHGRELLFGQVVDGEMRLSHFGEIARAEWLASADIRREIRLDVFVVMPNHVHGIVWIIANGDIVGVHGRAPLRGRVPQHGRAPRRETPSHLWRPPRSLGSFVAGYKSAVAKRINAIRGTPGDPVWQRNYYEHIIRNEQDLDVIRRYIRDNPTRWAEDLENPLRNQRTKNTNRLLT